MATLNGIQGSIKDTAGHLAGSSCRGKAHIKTFTGKARLAELARPA
jgi:hypothetical protein